MSSYTRLPAERQWQIVLHRIATLPLPANQAVVLEYLSERRASGGIDPSTLTADADEFKRFGAWAGERPFKELQKPDIVQFFGSITHKNPRTRYKTYLILRAFYRWLNGLDPDETPPQFKGFRMKRPPRKEIKPEELITPDELQAMLRLCRTTQERCLVAMLYEVGPRAEELLSVDIGGVEADAYGFILHMPDVDGLKTGPRPLRIIRAKAYLQTWLAEHAMRNKADAPLFYGLSNRAPYQRMGYQTLYALVKRLARDSKIRKRIYPHLYRHTSATEAAKRGLDGLAMTKAYGWSDTSEMPATYVHLSKQDVDRRILASYGIKTPDSGTSDGLRALVCPGCSASNTSDKVFCAACNAPLTPEAEAIIQKQKQAQWQEFIAQQVHQALKTAQAAGPGS